MNRPKDMKQSTWDFALEQCRQNGLRMAREVKGDYGQPIHIVSESTKETKDNFKKLFR